MPKEAGDQFETLTNITQVMTEGNCEVSHTQGEVLLVDFWATWCPPCQAPMAHNQKMLDDNKAAWGGKVRVIGLSCDQSVATVKSHCETKGWTSIEHYGCKGAGCTAAQDFGVSGIPCVALVDTNGKIVFKGHPASRPNLEKDLTDLLAGNTIA